MNDQPIPYGDYLFIEPVIEIGAVTSTLNCYAKVLAIGSDVKNTKVDEYVAFEKWDKPEFLVGDKVCHFLKESDAICKLPESFIENKPYVVQ